MPLSETINTNRPQTTSQTTTPLSGNGTWNAAGAVTGWLTTAGFARICGTVYSDVASAANGVVVEQSSDQTNADASTTYSLLAATPLAISVEVVAPYFRVRFVNGAGAQSVFRLYTTLRRI